MARCIEASADDLPQGLKRFEGLSGPRTSTIVRGSSEHAKRFHNPTLGRSSDGSRLRRSRDGSPSVSAAATTGCSEYDAVNALPLDVIDEDVARAVRERARDQAVGA